MRKIFFVCFIGLLSLITCGVYAQNSFTTALRTCDNYSQLGGVELGSEYYNILIALNKNKKTCTYKEKIYQTSGYQQLTCNFQTEQLGKIADIMDNFVTAYKKEISKNKIYEAKLTNSAEIFENYLINPKYCQVTKSKAK